MQDMLTAGATLSAILRAGQWRSAAFMRYLHEADIEKVGFISAARATRRGLAWRNGREQRWKLQQTPRTKNGSIDLLRCPGALLSRPATSSLLVSTVLVQWVFAFPALTGRRMFALGGATPATHRTHGCYTGGDVSRHSMFLLATHHT